MTYASDETIVAIASAAGPAARGIVRLSGPNVLSCLDNCFVPDGSVRLKSVRDDCVLSGKLPLRECNSLLPGELYLWPTCRSYTREPMAEWHTVGSPPLLQASLSAFCAAGARIAEPGEFTMRAFLAGRIDLTQAEAVLGVIDAAGKRDFEAALGQLAGGLGQRLNTLREDLLNLLAHLEAGLDFVEEDIEFISQTELQTQVQAACDQVEALQNQTLARSFSEDAFRVVLAGEPNVGKSSLLNALALQEEETPAIVSNIPGTTRDYLAVELNLDGIACRLIDTAGKEAASTGIASAAQRQTEEQVNQAQLVLFCVDSSRPLTDWEHSQLLEIEKRVEPPRLIVLTKCDQPRQCNFSGPAISTSTETMEGIEVLRSEVRAACLELCIAEGGVVASTAIRSQESLRLAHDSLQRSLHLASTGVGEEFIAAELRIALSELGKVVGVVYTDDILDRIFSRFCIGK